MPRTLIVSSVAGLTLCAVFLGLAVVLCRMRAPRRHYLLIAMAALQMFLLWRFLNFRWAG